MADKTTYTLDDFLNRYPSKKAAPAPEAEPAATTTATPAADAAKAKPNLFMFVDNAGKPTETKPDADQPFTEPTEPVEGDEMRGTYGEPSRGSYVQAKMLNRLSEVGLSNVAKIIAKAQSSKHFRPDEDLREDIEYLMAVVIEESDKKIPPGMLLALMMLVVWTPIMMAAYQVRREKTEAEENEPTVTDYTSNRNKRKIDENGIEEVEVEEILTREDMIIKLERTNAQAAEHGLDKFVTFDPPPPGKCRWHHMIEGRDIPTKDPKGKFYSTTENANYQSLRNNYKRYGIDFPGDWVK